jgi:hypothetical protein
MRTPDDDKFCTRCDRLTDHQTHRHAEAIQERRADPPVEQFDIRSDGRTVWVDSATGYTVARFGPMGVDVHTPDSTGCLDCTHGPTGPAEWDRFVASVHHHYGATVPDEHRPDHCHQPPS